MSALENLTPFAGICLPSVSRDGRPLTMVVVAGKFDFPSFKATSRVPTVAQEQGEVRLADEYRGEPTTSSLRYEGQSAPRRPGTDIHLDGHAWAPRGRPTGRSTIEVRVGRSVKRAVVFGDRHWRQGVAGVTPSEPRPFESMPVSYERCFGGSPPNPTTKVALVSDHNPVGRGLFNSEKEALSQPLPNVELPDALVKKVGDHPPPWGFGPIARHWRPRRELAGTYDDAWIDRQAPGWPVDMDERLFSAASLGLFAAPYLTGGEPVRLAGFSPDHDQAFALPAIRLRARFEVGRRSIRAPLVMDSVILEPDVASLTLHWRASVAADSLDVGVVRVRLLADWEAGS